MAAADFSLRDTPSPFQALGEISPGKTPRLSLHERRIYGPSPWSRELRGRLPARPEAARLTSGFCTSPRRSRYTAAFSDALTVVTLRFTRVVATNSPEDFHLLADSHAGHTNLRGASSWLPVVVSAICHLSSAISLTPPSDRSSPYNARTASLAHRSPTCSTDIRASRASRPLALDV